MKYFIDGKKVRTSKNTYTHAVVKGTYLIGCCGSYELAVKLLNSEKSRINNYIENHENSIKALKQGKTHTYFRDGRTKVYDKIRCTIAESEKAIANLKDSLKDYEIKELTVEQ